MTLNDGYAYRLQVQRGGESVLDFLAREFRHSTRLEWTARLQRAEVEVNGSAVTGPERLKPGQTLVWHRPPWPEEAVPLSFEVLYADDSLLAVNKPSGLPTLPGGGFLKHTLLTLVRERWPGASPLHRLGRGTSGVVLFALTGEAGAALGRAWRDHEVKKTYLALASGMAERDEYTISTPIGPVPHPKLGTVYAASEGGKPSLSHARVLQRKATSSVFQVDIQTGRPHQIRIHLAAIGHPLLGDPLYAAGGLPRPDLPGLPGELGYVLHAEQLRLTHPLNGRVVTLRATPPEALFPLPHEE